MKVITMVRVCLAACAIVVGVGSPTNAFTQTTVTTSGGTASYIPRFNGTATLGSSQIFDNGTTVGIGVGSTPNASAKLDVGGPAIVRGNLTLSRSGNASSGYAYPSYGIQFFSNAYNSSTHSVVNPYFTLRSEPTGNNTASPSATLNLLFSNNGSAPAETGLSVNPNGTLNFSSAQTFPIAAGPAGPAGPSGPAGAAGTQGPIGATGAAGGQVWSASVLFPATIANSSYVTAPPTGSSMGSSTYPDTVLPVPQTCTASNFTVSVLNAKGTSTATALLTNTGLSVLNEGLVEGSSIACTITASNGQPVSCTSTSTTVLPAANLIDLLFFNFSNGSDFESARAYVSFTCQ